VLDSKAIIKYIENHGSTGSRELSAHFGISRQALNLHLRRLIDDGKLFRTGSTRNARYHLSVTAEIKRDFFSDFQVTGLDESRIYQRLSLSLNLPADLKADVESIAHYAFTEMLNNVIDHSGSDKTRVRATLGAGKLCFEIKDWGKGVFASIADRFSLEKEYFSRQRLQTGSYFVHTESSWNGTVPGVMFFSQHHDMLKAHS